MTEHGEVRGKRHSICSEVINNTPEKGTLTNIWKSSEGDGKDKAVMDSVQINNPPVVEDGSSIEGPPMSASCEPDEGFDRLVPIIVAALQPIIERAVSLKFEALSSKLDAVIEGNKNDTINKKLDSMAETIDEIPYLIKEFKGLQSKVNVIDTKCSDLRADLEKVEKVCRLKMDELEQHGRRNSLRFLRVDYGKLPMRQVGQREEVDTDAYVHHIITNRMSVPLPANAIGRSHLLGPPKDGYCNIIVRFSSYNVRQMVYKNRSCLKESPDSNIRLVEDLTRFRQDLIRHINALHRSKKLYSFWTKDGRLFVKKLEGSRPQEIHDSDDLASL